LNTTLLDIRELRLLFWNEKDRDPPTTTERKTKLCNSLSKFFDTLTKKFRYTIGKDGNKREICEQAWLRILGRF